MTNGASGFGLALCYLVSDVLRSPVLAPFRWMGMNSILVYLLSCSGLLEQLLSLW